MDGWTKARVRWLAEQPTGAVFSSLAHFDDSAADWSIHAWRVVVLLGASGFEAEVSFLSPAAPAHLLRPGVSFSLYEKGQRVAEVEVP